jgi:hypothetical protein
MLDVATMESLMRVADMMASGKSTVPKHLQGNPADCMAVVMQSMQWGMNPFAVAQKTHLVGSALGYEAQLVNAVVQESRSIQGRFHYEYQGKSPALECRVGAVLRGEQEITWGNWLGENKVTTKNSPLWKTDPAQQLGYLQVKNWARLFCPGAILGVYTPDELERPAPVASKAINPETGEIGGAAFDVVTALNAVEMAETTESLQVVWQIHGAKAVAAKDKGGHSALKAAVLERKATIAAAAVSDVIDMKEGGEANA